MLKVRLALVSLAATSLFASSYLAVAGGPAETYTITLRRVEVMKTKTNGEAWDINDGKPDLAVKIRNTSEKNEGAKTDAEKNRFTWTSSTKDDSFEADFNEKCVVKVKLDQTIEFEVIDKDVVDHDSVAKTDKKLTAEILKAGKLKLENTGRVVSLEIEIKKD